MLGIFSVVSKTLSLFLNFLLRAPLREEVLLHAENLLTMNRSHCLIQSNELVLVRIKEVLRSFIVLLQALLALLSRACDFTRVFR